MSGHTRASGPPTRLLLAGGDPSLRRVLHLALQAHGYQVALADSADTALELAGHEHPDLVVLDLGLPGVVDLVHALRQTGATAILLLIWPAQPQSAGHVGHRPAPPTPPDTAHPCALTARPTQQASNGQPATNNPSAN